MVYTSIFTKGQAHPKGPWGEKKEERKVKQPITYPKMYDQLQRLLIYQIPKENTAMDLCCGSSSQNGFMLLLEYDPDETVDEFERFWDSTETMTIFFWLMLQFLSSRPSQSA